jgi:hypothetical protein
MMKPHESQMPATAREAVEKVLAHLASRAKTPQGGVPEDLFAVPELPLSELSQFGTLNRLEDSASADVLPSLLLETSTGQMQMEICPFGPLALITSDGEADTDPPAQALRDAGLWPLFQNDLDSAGHWHGMPLARWLFPRRLSDALALFETLRG